MYREPTYSELTKRVIELTSELEHERKKKAVCEDILENANSLILKMGPDGTINYMNKFAQAEFGYSNKEIIGKNVIGTIVPKTDSSGQFLFYMIQDITKNPDRYVNNENENIRKNGERIWVAWTNKAIFNQRGEVSEIVCIGNDITDRKDTEAALRKSEEKYRDLFENGSDLLCYHDLSGNIIHTNLAFKKEYGWSEKELVGMNIRDLTPKKYQHLVRGYLKRVKKNDKDEGIMRVVTKDARELIIEYRNSLIYDQEKPIGVHGSARDITRRVKAEEQLRISEEKFSKAFRNSPVWVVLSELETGRYIDVNDSFLFSTGYQRDEVIGKTSIELGLWVDTDQRKKILKEVKEKGSVQHIEVNRRNKSGQIVTMLFFGEIIEIGEETCFLSVSLDITDRKHMEMLVRESEKRYRTILQANPDPMALYDMDGAVTYVNQAFEKKFGWTLDELIGKSLDFVPEENWPETRAVINDMINGKKISSFETRRLTKEGDVLDIQISASVFKYPDAKHAGSIVTLRDITVQKRAEKVLKESEKKYRVALEANPDPVIVYNMEGNVTYVNPAFTRVFGWSLEERIGKKLDDFVPEENWPETRMMIDKVLVGESFYGIETRRLTKQGNVIPVSISASFYRDQEGNIEASVINLRDVTDQKHAEEALRKHAETQEVLLREVNHRVKNNLSAIIGMLYKEQERAEEYGLTPYLDVLGDLVGRVEGLSMVHSLLSASGWRPLLLTGLCEQVVNSALQVIPLDKKISLDVRASPLRVSSDQAHHLTLVVNELATNTIKHALKARDSVQIRVDFIRNGKMVQIVFRDDGPGYPQDMIEKNFSRASIGFDLILGIVTESLRGNVQLDNDNGAVTTVTFKIEEVKE